MQRGDLKNNKTERKPIGKRHEGKSSFLSINNFPTIDKVPNDNLYKNDNLYSINSNFEFPPNEEKSFRLFFHYHYFLNKLIFFYIK